MEDDSAAVALGADEAFETVLDAERCSQEAFGDRSDRAAPDVDRDLAGDAELNDFRLVLQADVERWQPGRGESQSASLDDRRRQDEPVRQAAAASCGGARRDSSRSTFFIITEGDVSAWLLTTVR